jgi:hypothetical protein
MGRIMTLKTRGGKRTGILAARDEAGNGRTEGVPSGMAYG